MSWTVADAVDYKGFPADRSKTGGWVPAALILGKGRQGGGKPHGTLYNSNPYILTSNDNEFHVIFCLEFDGIRKIFVWGHSCM
ncbi:hypothetical protein Gogos_016155 [Gossypium gossypioides]|uniref:Uncharacterized protein n=1 Tax=Gossypium gossypioides TaxID=34282 RepID=A0A7J9B6X1_GOSGO|nr:hypothetical protein [Gossypium gossypioides]